MTRTRHPDVMRPQHNWSAAMADIEGWAKALPSGSAERRRGCMTAAIMTVNQDFA